MNNAAQCGLATTLLATPFWADALHMISTALSTVSVVCGAIIGVTTVYRMFRRHYDT